MQSKNCYKEKISEQNKLAHAKYKYNSAKQKTECVKCIAGRLSPFIMIDDKEDPMLPRKIEGMMCLNCGDLIDTIVLKHRADNVSVEADYDAYYDSLGVKNEEDENYVREVV
jgi:hypothetical protein